MYYKKFVFFKSAIPLLIFIFCILCFYPILTTKADENLPAEAKLEVIEFEAQHAIDAFVYYLVQWAFRLAGLIAFIMILFAGFQYLTAGGNTNQQKEAQERIFNAIIGIILLFSFWLILNTINPNILGEKKEPSPPLTEDEKQDIEEGQSTEETPQEIINFVLIGPGSSNYANIPLSNQLLGYDAVYIDQKTAVKLLQLAESAPKGWTVTEACVGISSNGKCVTTYGGHSSLCHDLGTCVDVGFGGDPGNYIRTEFIYAANQAGFDVLDEYKCPQYDSGFHVEPDKTNCVNDGCWFCA